MIWICGQEVAHWQINQSLPRTFQKCSEFKYCTRKRATTNCREAPPAQAKGRSRASALHPLPLPSWSPKMAAGDSRQFQQLERLSTQESWETDIKTMTPSYVQHHTAIIRDLYRTAKSRMGSCPLRSKETWIVPVSTVQPIDVDHQGPGRHSLPGSLSETALRVGQMPSLDLTWLIQIYPKQHKNPQIDINCRDPSLSQTHVRIQLRCCLPQWARKGQNQILSKQTYDRQVPMLDTHLKLRNLRMSFWLSFVLLQWRPLHVHRTCHNTLNLTGKDRSRKKAALKHPFLN